MCPAWHPGSSSHRGRVRRAGCLRPSPLPSKSSQPGRQGEADETQPAVPTPSAAPAEATNRPRSNSLSGRRAAWPPGHSPGEATELSRRAPGGAQSPGRLGCPLPPPPGLRWGRPRSFSDANSPEAAELATSLHHIPALWPGCVPALRTTEGGNSGTIPHVAMGLI